MNGLAATRSAAAFAREWLVPSRAMPRRVWPPLLGILYIAAVGLLGGLRSDHVLIGLLGFLDLYNERTRRFLREFFPFILTGVVFDSMRYFYWPGIAGRVHVEGPYLWEKSWFGIDGRTPNEWFAAHHWPVLDLATGFAYLVYVGEYLLIAMWLFFRGEERTLRVMAFGFLLVNLLGFATYFLYPVAPPWYVAEYGFGPARVDISPAPAAAIRFDQLLGTHFFAQMYGRGVDVYGAFPSLHVAYPLIAVCATFREKSLRWARAPVVAFFFLMCLSAVYLQHHYVIDVLLGILYAVVTLAMLLAPSWIRHRRAARASSAQPAASGSSRHDGPVARRSASE